MAQTKTKTKTQTETAKAQLPDKYSRKLTAANDAVWWRPEGATMVEAIMLGRFERKGGKRGMGSPYYYQARVVGECQWADKDGQTVIATDGETINLPEKAALTGLAALDAGTQFALIVHGKATLSNGNSFWQIEIGAVEMTDEAPF